MNLNETHHTVLLSSSYSEFLSLSSKSSSPTSLPITRHSINLIVQNALPDVSRLVRNFQAQLTNVPRGHAEIVPYFPEYLDSLTSTYKGYRLVELEVTFVTPPRHRWTNLHHRSRSSKSQLIRQVNRANKILLKVLHLVQKAYYSVILHSTCRYQLARMPASQ